MSTVITIMFITFLVLLFLQVPIGFAIGFACLIFLSQTNAISISTFGTTMYTAVDSFPLMAIPLFILTGALMEGGGLAKRLIDFMESFVGQFTGGIAMAGIIACAFFGAISGSALATVAAIGVIAVPMMIQNGYDKKFSYGLIAVAGCLGVIIPPSIPMILYSASANVSVATLFLGGFGPGILITVALCILVHFMCKKRGYKGNGIKFSFKNVWRTFKSSIWALIIPVMILGGIYGGLFTPTEAAAVAVFYCVIAGKFIYKELTFAKFCDSFQSTAISNASILIIVATATIFGRVLTISQIPTVIVKSMSGLTDSPIVLLLALNIMLLIAGCILDTTAAIILLTPMIYPLLMAYGINPLHFGIVMVLNLAIGLCTPPVGANLYVASGISGLSFSTITRHVIPFLLVMLVILFAVTYIPDIALFVPKFFNRI